MKTLKALYIQGKECLSFRTDAPIPEISERETLIRIKYAGICGSDVHNYRNGIDHFGGKPFILGHEFIGTVVKIGDPSQADYQVGDTVTALTFDACGKCEPCRNGRPSICESLVNCGFGKDGTYAEYVKVDSSKVYKFREGINKRAAILTEPLAVAVFDLAMSGFRVGQSVFISGGGPIGAIIAALAKTAGASKIAISEINENRLPFLRSLGAKTFNPLQQDVLKDALAWNDNEKFDVAFEVAGAQSSYDLIFNVIKRGGTVVPVAPVAAPRSIAWAPLLRGQIRIVPVNLYDDIYFADAVRIVNSGMMDDVLEKFVTNIYPIDQAQEAYLASMNPTGSHVKILIDCDPEHD